MAHVVVLVLGDIGRSPRMQYHALSLASMPSIHRITIVGYTGEDALPDLKKNNKVHFSIIEPPRWLQPLKSIPLLFAMLKGLCLLSTLFFILFFSLPYYHLLLIQNPPALPALIAALLVKMINSIVMRTSRNRRSFHLMLDWHNLGFSMYEYSMGSKHLLTRLARVLESKLVRYVDSHICVSQALSNWLQQHFHIKANVCYDKPAQIISQKNIDLRHRHDLLKRMALFEKYFMVKKDCLLKDNNVETIQTVEVESSSAAAVDVIRKKDENGRVALIVTSTSWTADEDFSLLFQALLKLELFLKEQKEEELCKGSFNRLLVVITGKGEMKASFEEQVRLAEKDNLLGNHVFVRTAWLAVEDYPLLLQCADLGISLHASTSGLDLPMKVVDMFGAGLPVCALHFPALPELVQNEVNGLVFHDQNQLVDQILRLLFRVSGEEDDDLLEKMRHHLVSMERWAQHWDNHMRPVVEKAICS